MEAEPRRYTLQEVADISGLKLASIQRYVAAGLLRAEGMPELTVVESDFLAWNERRTRRHHHAELHGDVLTTAEACKRFRCSPDVLQTGVNQGRLAVARLMGINGTSKYWGSDDVSAFLAQRQREEMLSLSSVVAFTGVNLVAFQEAMKAGRLGYVTSGRLRVLNEEDLARWLESEAPPYRKEVAHLGGLVTPERAADLSGLGIAAVQQAVREGPLVILRWTGSDGPRSGIPRCCLDGWLCERGLAPSWELERDQAEWLRVCDAASLSGMAIPTIQKWLKTGAVEARRSGRRWLIRRESLERLLANWGAEVVSEHLTVPEASSRFKVARTRVIAAVQSGALPCYRLGEGRYWRRYLKPQDVEAWIETIDKTRAKIEKVPPGVPIQSAPSFTVEEAATLAKRSASRLRQAIRTGDLETTPTAEGVRISREALDRYLLAVFHRRGGTLQPGTLSLSDAAELARSTTTNLRVYLDNGALPYLRNPAGYPIVERAELERWLAGRPPLQQNVDGSGRSYELKEIAVMVKLKLATVQSDVIKGLLKATLVTPNGKGKTRYVVAEKDLMAWIKQRDARYRDAPLRGDVLSTREACQRFGCTADILDQGARTGQLPVARRFASNGVGKFWGSQDIEDYLLERSRCAEDCTVSALAELTGIRPARFHAAVRNGILPTRKKHRAGRRPTLVLELLPLVNWLETQAPPYCKEVAHLSSLLGPRRVAQISGLPSAQVTQALRERQLRALVLPDPEGGSDRYFVPRRAFDLWLTSLGLAPSWKLEVDSRWLRIPDAVRLVGLSQPTLQQWVSLGWVEAKRRGRRWLIDRQSLLCEAENHRRWQSSRERDDTAPQRSDLFAPGSPSSA